MAISSTKTIDLSKEGVGLVDEIQNSSLHNMPAAVAIILSFDTGKHPPIPTNSEHD